MDNIYIKVADLNKWISKYFPNKDLITVEDLLGLIEDLDSELENKKIEYDELENDLHENYIQLSPYQIYGVSERDFH